MRTEQNGRRRRVSLVLAAVAAVVWALGAGPSWAQTSGNVTWDGGGATAFWNDANNWAGNLYPNNPTTGQVLFGADLVGQSVTGKLDAARTIGSMRLASGWDAWSQTPRGQRHTIDLNGYRLTLAGNLDTDNVAAHRYLTFIGGGIVQFGTDSAEAGLLLYGLYGGNGVVTFAAGTTIDSYRMGTVRIGSTDNGSNRGWNGVDLRGAAVAGGVLTVKNLYVTTKSGQDVGLMFDGTTVLNTLWVTNELDFGDSAYNGGNAYIGDPSTLKLPANVNVQVGNSPSSRGARLRIGRGATAAQLAASSGGWFKAYVTDLVIGDPACSGTLDIRAMTNCTIDATTFTVCKESGTPSATPKAAARLCAGTVTAGTVALGSTVSGGYGLLEMSNTLFTVTNSYTINTTATNLISLGATPSGLDVSGTLVDGGGRIVVKFLESPSVATNWAIRVAGNAQSVLNGMIGASPSRLTYTGSYSGKKAGVLYDGTYTYFAMADSNAFSTLPIAVAHDQRTYEYAPGYPVTVATNDINNGSSDPESRPLTMTIYTNGGAESASLTFDATNDYGVTLKVAAGAESATDTCTVHVVSVHSGAAGNLTWKGGAPTALMDRREWMWSGNWLEGTPPTNPTIATIYYRTAGQATVGRIEAPRTIGGIGLGEGIWDTVSHTLDLGGTVLTLAGSLGYADIAYPTLALTNGTLRIGSDTVVGNVTVGGGNYGSASLLCRAGTIIETRRVGTLRAGRNTGSNAQYGRMDLRNATVAGGILSASNIVVGARNTSYIAIDNTTAIDGIAVSNALVVGETSYGGVGYIGNPADPSYRLPANVSLQVGSGPTARGSIQIGVGGGGQAMTAVMAASSGGSFTGWLTALEIMPAGNPSVGIGTLDLGGMTNCAVDAQTIRVASGGAGVDLRGTLKLPPGTVTAGTVEIGTTNGAAAAFGLLTMSNTTFAVTNTFTIQRTGRVQVNVGVQSCGLVISNAADTALSLATATNGALRVVFNAKPAVSPFYGLWWAGDHVAALDALVADGRLVIDSSGMAPRTASILATGGATIIGLAPPRGAVFVVR